MIENEKPSDPIRFLCGMESAERIRQEAPKVGVTILREKSMDFVGSKPEIMFFVQVDKITGFMVPLSQRAKDLHPECDPYYWVLSGFMVPLSQRAKDLHPECDPYYWVLS